MMRLALMSFCSLVQVSFRSWFFGSLKTAELALKQVVSVLVSAVWTSLQYVVNEPPPPPLLMV